MLIPAEAVGSVLQKNRGRMSLSVLAPSFNCAAKFLCFPAQSVARIFLLHFLGKRSCPLFLWKPVYDCAKKPRLCDVMSLVCSGQHFGKVIDDRVPRLVLMLLSRTFSRQRCVAGHAQSCRRALQGKQGSTSRTYGRRRTAQHPNLELRLASRGHFWK